VDLEKMNTSAISRGIEEAERLLGYKAS